MVLIFAARILRKTVSFMYESPWTVREGVWFIDSASHTHTVFQRDSAISMRRKHSSHLRYIWILMSYATLRFDQGDV